MKKTTTTSLTSYLLLFLILVFSHQPSAVAQGIAWDKVDGKDVSLFYPGQSSWEWALTKSSHSGAVKFRQGKSCRDCHDGEQDTMGALILSGEKLEPTPFPYKDGSVKVNVKTAYDNSNIYVRLEWLAVPLTGEHIMDKNFEAKIALMIDDGTLPETIRTGCWSACHDDVNSMASSQAGIDMKKYHGGSRLKLTRTGGGENYKSDDELKALSEQGAFLEYWQARLNKGAVAVAMDGAILKERHEEEAPIVHATSHYDAGTGKWVVEFSRALAPAKAGHKAFASGKTYSIGFALHEGHSTERFHYVSFGYTLVLDQGTADFITLKQNP